MRKRILIFVHLAAAMFVFHLIEQAATGFYKTNPSMQMIAVELGLPTLTAYLLIQIALFVFLGMLLFLVLKKKVIPLLLVLVLDIVLLYQFSYTVSALRAGTYVSGYVTGTFLGIFGIGLLYTLIKGAVKGE